MTYYELRAWVFGMGVIGGAYIVLSVYGWAR